MPKRYHLNRPDLAQAVAVELRTCQDVKSQQRLLAARLAASGQLTAAQIAEQLGISRRRFFDWMNALKAGGLVGLLERQHGGGAAPQVKGDACKELLAGLQSGRWKRAKEIQHWLRDRHQIRLKLPGVYYWLGKLGGVLKVPRKTHAQKDAAAAEAFQHTLCAQLASLTVAGGRPVRLWVADEHRYGLIPVVRKCWTLRGVRPTVPYPVYLELARAAGIEPRIFTTLPEPKIPVTQPNGSPEYLLITNPWKPLGRYLTDKECDALTGWLAASPHRHLLMDCVYDLGAPFHITTQNLHGTGRAILLHSATKGWLWPKTFGIALLGAGHSQFESVFRNDLPTPDQLRLAQQFLSTDTNCPSQVIAALQSRAKKLFAAMPDSVRKSLLLDPACLAPSCYFFPVGVRPEELLRQHRLLAIPGSAFGADWDGSILTSLASAFAPIKSGGAQ